MTSGSAQATSPTLHCRHHPSHFDASQCLTTLPCSCLPWQAPLQLPCSALLALSQPLRCTNDEWLSTGHATHPSLLASSQLLQCLSMPRHLALFVSSLVGTTSTPMLCVTGIVPAALTPLIQMMSGSVQATSPTLCCWHHPSCFDASQCLATSPCLCLPWQAPPQCCLLQHLTPMLSVAGIVPAASTPLI